MDASLLLIEPQTLCRDLLAKVLETNGYRVTSAGDGIEALRALQKNKPDVIILSSKLPRLSGIDLIRVLRRTPALCEVPVLVLAEEIQPDQLRSLASLGVRNFLLKSKSSLGTLLERLTAMLRAAAARPATPAGPPDRGSGVPAGETQPATPVTRHVPAARAAAAAAAAPPAQAAPQPDVPKLLTREQVLERVDKCADSKTLAGVVSQIVALASSPRGSVADLVALLKQDVVLATRVLQVANTAAYASNKSRITSIEEAVRNVGLGTVRNIALSVGVFEAFPPEAGDGFSLLRCWQHSVGVAAILDRLTSGTDGMIPGAAHLIGLCHDVGELILRQCLAEQYDELAKVNDDASGASHQVESEAFGISYPELNEKILSKLGLPPDIAAPIRESVGRRRPGARPSSKLGQALVLADLYAHGLQLASSHRAPVAPVSVADYRAATGAAVNAPAIRIDGTVVRCEVLCSVGILARLSPAAERELSKPMFPSADAKIWYARHPGLSTFDPLEMALSSLAQVKTHERLPLPVETEELDGLVVAVPRHDLAPMPMDEAERLCKLGEGKPLLYLCGTATHGLAATTTTAQVRQYPISFEALARFVALAAGEKQDPASAAAA